MKPAAKEPAAPAPATNGARAAGGEVRILIIADRESTLSAPTAGRVASIDVRLGDAVAAGPVLVAFDCDEINARREAAWAETKTARLQHEAKIKLQGLESAAEVEVELAAMNVDRAEAQARVFDAQLAQCRFAPAFAARVARIHVKTGQSVTAGAPIIDVVSTESLKARINVSTQVIAAPMDGVIRRITVAPNTPVKQGDTIAELDATTQRNRVAVARAALATARAEFLQSSQRAFESQQAKADLVQAQARVRESEAELAWLSEDLSRLQIRAPAAGVFVYSDPDDWAGKPVQTGERIGLLADPQKLGVQAWVPVGEAINLQPGAAMTLFLRIAPLSPLAAKLDHAAYQVTESPEAVASYRVRGTLADAAIDARVGLRGTVRIGGDSTVLGYLVMRRPFAWLREWCGC